MADDLSADLAEIREWQRAAHERTGDAALWIAAMAHLADEGVPRLLAAVDVVLALHHLVTDDDAHCDECRHLPHCGNCGGPWPCLEYQAISEAITRELAGKGNDDARP